MSDPVQPLIAQWQRAADSWDAMGYPQHADLLRSCAADLTAVLPQVGILPLAERIARRAHEGQCCTVTGEPYIRHVERVVASVTDDDAKAVAWLHDVLEDAPLKPFALDLLGVPAHIIEAVKLVARDPGHQITYAEYIEILVASGNRLALKVKEADLRDHLHPNCPERLRPRYEKALPKIIAALFPAPQAEARTEGT